MRVFLWARTMPKKKQVSKRKEKESFRLIPTLPQLLASVPYTRGWQPFLERGWTLLVKPPTSNGLALSSIW